MPSGIYTRTQKHKNILSQSKTEEVRKRMSRISKSLGLRPPSRKGTKLSEEQKIKKRAENHPRWKGGVSWEYRIKSTPRPSPEQCELCGAFGMICFDHDHKTGKFRGWICKRCNITLGFVRDSQDLLLLMIDYLKKGR